MKIQEITEGYVRGRKGTKEGWGEYSNKSNHTMNKLKRKDEAGFGQWLDAKATQASNAASGSLGRSFKRGAAAVGAKMGIGKAKGAQQLQQVTNGVYKNFQRYLGQSGNKSTAAALGQYLKALGLTQVAIVEISRADMLAKNQARVNAPAKQTPAKPAPSVAQSQQKGTTVDPQKVLDKNEVMMYIQKNIQAALQKGTLPKELQKFLG